MPRRNRDPYQHAERNLFCLSCSECGRQLARTPSGYLACPQGHGALKEDAYDAPEADDTPTLFDLASA
jgi:hypothetical protein